MKLTPEQKALIAYVNAVQDWKHFLDLYRRHTCISAPARRHKIREGGNLRNLLEQDLATEHDNLIRDAWQKRAACRAWMIPSHERICENCAYESTHPCATPCSECFRFPFTPAYEGFSDNWEPRKEDSND